MPTAHILSQGDEVVTGQVVDTNAAWLATRLIDLGFDVVGHAAVPDRLPDLVAALRRVAGEADLVVCTGGLGPTADDLTAEAVAGAFGRPLIFDVVAMAAIEARYAAVGRPMPEANRKQAWLPEGCVRIDNAWGTAPGFGLAAGVAWLAFLPGVPREMRPMFDERVVPGLHERFSLRPGRLVTVRTIGIAEAEIQERLRDLPMPEGVALGFRTTLPENHVKLRTHSDISDEVLRDLARQVVQRLGSSVFTVEGVGAEAGGGSFPEVLGRTLLARGETVAVAESCTGGRLAAALTGVAGASAWFLEGRVTYANEAKVRLGVSADMLAAVGAVSEEVARSLAESIRAKSGATYGLATTGIAGPGGGSEEKPVGTVWLALAGPQGTTARRIRLPGDRDRVQQLAAAGAMDLLRRQLDFTPPHPPDRSPP